MANKKSCLSVVVPAFNEGCYLERCLAAVLAQVAVLEVIVVDDCSTDETISVVQSAASMDSRVRLVSHAQNRGKGAAVRTGFALCRGEIVVVQDADLEYDPACYPKLLEPILVGRADASLGSRFLGGGSHRVLYFWHYVTNRFLTVLSNCFTGLNLTDMECGLKAVKLDTLRRVTLREERFGFEPEIVAKLARLRVSFSKERLSSRKAFPASRGEGERGRG